MVQSDFPKIVHLVNPATPDFAPGIVSDARSYPDRQRYTGYPEGGVDWERVARATLHPTKVAVLDALAQDRGRVMSPNELSKELGEALGNVSHHVKSLFELGLLEAAGTEPRRGAVEHYYRLAGEGW
jgi:DNA-binding transcriptional ArsR family regulator